MDVEDTVPPAARDRSALAVADSAIQHDRPTRQTAAGGHRLDADMLGRIFDAASEGILIANDKGIIADANSAALSLLGYGRSELIGQPIEVLLPEPLRHGHVTRRLSFVGNPAVRPMGEGREVTALRRDGSELPIEISLTHARIRGRFFVMALLTDVSRSRHIGRELDRFFALSIDLMCVAGMDGHFKRVNPAFTGTLGHSIEELLSRPFLDLVHPDDRESTVAEVAALQKGSQTVGFENRYRCSDGTYKWLSWTASPLPDTGLIYAVGRDVSEQKAKDEQLRALNAALELSNSELSDFTYVVSHDLKEPLRGIEAFSAFLVEDYGGRLDREGHRYVEVIRDSAIRMKHLIEDLLELSRIGHASTQRSTVDVASVISAVREDLAFKLHETGTELRVPADLPSIVCNETRLKQVFMNLVSNAIKFNDKPNPLVEISWLEDDETTTFAVRDNGIGIAGEYFDKIFEVFQRLNDRDAYEGTGAGLTICRKIVQSLGGRIWVESTPDEGSRFMFQIPSHGPGEERASRITTGADHGAG